MRLVAYCMAGVMLFPVLAWGEDQVGAMESIKVTGSAIPYPPEQFPAAVQVLDSAEIQKRVDSNMTDLFRGLPGIEVVQIGGDGGMTSLLLRGGEPNFTTIMIDGVKVNDPTNSRGGAFDLAVLDPSMVERVDILRGAASPVFGSDALSGVVNFITRRASDQPVTRIGGQYGTDDAYNLSFSHARQLGSVSDISLGAGYTEGGDSVEGNELERLNIHFGGGSNPVDNLEIRFGLFYGDVEAQNFPEDSGGPRLAVSRELQTRDGEYFSGYVKGSYRFAEGLELVTVYNISRIDETVFSPAIYPGVLDAVPSYATVSDFSRDEFIANLVYEVSARLTVSAGASHMREKGSDDGFIDFGFLIPTEFSLDRHVNSLFAEARLDLSDACGLAAGGRWDDPDNLASETTVRLYGECGLDRTGTRFFASYGEGFKMPSFYALGNPLVGNPDLRPERSKNYEVGVIQSVLEKKLQLDLRYYRNEFVDLVDFDAETFRNVNRGKVTVDGVDLGLRFLPAREWEIDLSVGYMDVSAGEGVPPLRHRPEWKGSARVAWQASEELQLGVSAFFSGRFYDSSVATGLVELSSYGQLDLFAHYNVGETASLKLSVRNVTKSDHEELIGVPNPGRIARLALEQRF